MSTATTTAPTIAPTIAPTDAQKTDIGVVLLILIIVLVLVGIYCLVKSFMCFGKSGTTLEKIFGVIIAFFTGPFYLLYLNFNEGYCNDEVAQVQQVQQPVPMVGGRRHK